MLGLSSSFLFCSVLTKSRLQFRITDQIRITGSNYWPNPDYKFGLLTKSRLQVRITDQIRITGSDYWTNQDYRPNPDYRFGLLIISRLQVRISDSDYWPNPGYGFGLRIRIYNQDNLVHDVLKIDQDLPFLMRTMFHAILILYRTIKLVW